MRVGLRGRSLGRLVFPGRSRPVLGRRQTAPHRFGTRTDFIQKILKNPEVCQALLISSERRFSEAALGRILL
jgi:hypothetical protein